MADRYPTPRLLVGLLGTAALLVLAIPFVDGWTLDRVVAWDPGPRLNPVIATILLFGLPSLVLGSVSPVAVRLKARSIDELGRTAGRLFAISTAGSIAGTFLTSFWLIPELGTDQVLASAAIALMLAAAAVALVERLAIAFASPSCSPVQALGRSSRWRPTRAGRLPPRSFGIGRRCTGSGLSRSQRRDRGIADRLQDRRTPRTRSTTASPSSTTTPVATSASTAPFRAACTSDDPYRTRFSYSDYLQLPFRLPGADEEDALHRARRRLGPKRPGATSPACESTSSSSTRRSSTWPTSTSSCPAIRGWPSRSRTVAVTCRGHEGPWDVIVSMRSTPTRSHSTSRPRSSSSSLGRG